MRLISACSGIALMMLAAGCASQPQTRVVSDLPLAPSAPSATGPASIGLLLPLTGNASVVGNDMLLAAQMALFDAGESEITLLPKDTGDTPEGAVAAARAATAQNARLLVGPLFSRSTAAVADVARGAGIDVISFSNDATVAGGPVYVLGYRPEEQVQRILSYAVANGSPRIAALLPDDAYGNKVAAAVRSSAAGISGIELVDVAMYPPDQPDVSSVVRRLTRYDQRGAALEARRQALAGATDAASQQELKRLQTMDTDGPPPFDAVLMADAGPKQQALSAMLAYFDVDASTTRFLGTMRWMEDADVLNEPTMAGAEFAAMPPAELTAFRNRFTTVFGHEPKTLAALAYDATALAVDLSRNGRGFGAEALTEADGFTGATGPFRFVGSGQAEHALSIVAIRGRSVAEVEPAPVRFDTDVLSQ